MSFFSVKVSSPAWKGVLWKLLACVFFSLSNALVKSLSLPFLQVACCQNLIGGLFLLCVIGKSSWALLSTWPSTIRSAVSIISVLSWTYSVQKLPLFQSVSLGFMGPFFTALGAKIFLKETLSIQRTISIMLGVSGGVLLLEGSKIFKTPPISIEENTMWVIAIPICAALSSSLSNILGKKLLNEKFSPGIIACTLMISVGMVLLPSISFWTWPTEKEMLSLLLCGLVLAYAHWCLGKAFSYTDLSFLLPIGSFKLALGAWIGVIFFKEYPTWWMICGSCVIFLALLMLSWKQNEKKDFSQKPSH